MPGRPTDREEVDALNTAALIVAAGRGSRMGATTAKQYLKVRGKVLLEYSLDFFEEYPGIGAMVLVLPPEDVEPLGQEYRKRYPKLLTVVPGGSERQSSVLAGLRAVPRGFQRVAVHDGVRPVLDTGLLDRLLGTDPEVPAVIPVIPVVDSLKEVDGDGVVRYLPDRSMIRRAQTPQVFSRAQLLEILEEQDPGKTYTDESSLYTLRGLPVLTVPGEETNIKVTTPLDLRLASLFLEDRP